MKCYCGHPKSMHDSDCDERQEKFWCNGKDCDCGRFIPFRESRPTQLAPDRAKSARKSKPSASKRSKSGAAGKA